MNNEIKELFEKIGNTGDIIRTPIVVNDVQYNVDFKYHIDEAQNNYHFLEISINYDDRQLATQWWKDKNHKNDIKENILEMIKATIECYDSNLEIFGIFLSSFDSSLVRKLKLEELSKELEE